MLSRDPFELLEDWLAEAAATGMDLPEAFSLATATPQGRPSVRILLYKGRSGSGFRFFTNLESRKADELRANPVAAMCFWWPQLGKQIRIEGAVELLGAEEADAYFASRPRNSQIGAWASSQSKPLESRGILEQRVSALDQEYQDADVPRPPHWGGYRLTPTAFEFWVNGDSRLHDRFRFTCRDGNWRSQRLSP